MSVSDVLAIVRTLLTILKILYDITKDRNTQKQPPQPEKSGD